jgi:4-hydroxybenzoate polyprenyltransferase
VIIGNKANTVISWSKYWLIIAYRMLRIRTVLIMVTFEAIGYEVVKPTKFISIKFLLVAVMLGTLYICATCFNDAADEEIDKINLPNDVSRPLVTAKATGKQLQRLGILALVVATIAAVLISPVYLLFVLAGALLNIFYSVSPFKISYRGIWASLWLPFSYVVLPFLAGAYINGGNLTRIGWFILAAEYSCFVGRILLKDFRDYEGDKKFGKLNFLVRHGPILTCLASGTAWLIGDVIATANLYHSFPVFIYLVQPLICIILYELYLLAHERNYDSKLLEVSAIGRTGNAIALALLTTLTLQAFSYSAIQKNLTILAVGTFMALNARALWGGAALKKESGTLNSEISSSRQLKSKRITKRTVA